MFSENLILKKEIKKKFKNIEFNYKKIDKKYLLKKKSMAEGVVLGLQPFDKDVIKAFQNLKVISRFGVGLDNIDLKYCKEKKIKVSPSFGCNSLSVAELVISNSINLLRNINLNNNLMQSGKWEKINGNEIFEKTFGIVGMGSVGKELAKRLVPFGCKILVNDLKIDKVFCKKHKLKISSLNYLLKNSDVISLHLPLTKKTNKMINFKTLNILKKNCILINTSRGQLIDLDALSKFLNKKEKNIKVFLDVFPVEPFKNKNLLKNKNSIFTPHIGGTTEESKLRMGRKNISDLISVLKKN